MVLFNIIIFVSVLDKTKIHTEELKFYDNLNRELDEARIVKCIKSYQHCGCFYIKVIDPVVNAREKTKFSEKVNVLAQ